MLSEFVIGVQLIRSLPLANPSGFVDVARLPRAPFSPLAFLPIQRDERKDSEIFCPRQRILADPVRYSAAIGFCLRNRVPGRSGTGGASDWQQWPDTRSRLFVGCAWILRFPARCYASPADAFLVWRVRSRPQNLRLGWPRAVADRSRRLRQCDSSGVVVGHLHVDRSYRQYLVRLRMGDSASRNRVLVHFSLSAAGRASVSKIATAYFGAVAFSLARIPNHGGLGFD